MLQQTRVARVLERWQPWLDRWPTAQALAATTPADVLRAWVGLGYNRRALRLREACVVVAERGWPDDLTELPGVGAYTAAALRAFAYDEPVVPVDVNVARVFSRAGISNPPSPPTPPELGHALMDLGATICTARSPRCDQCPLVGCRSRGSVAEATRSARSTERFEDSNRWVRGRVIAALAAGERLPDIAGDRLEPALAGLVRDGLVIVEGERYALPT